MPSWVVHEKWCQVLGIERYVCREINKIIDSPPHDIVDKLLEWRWARDLFESGRLKEPICIVPGDTHGKVTAELAEITNGFGEEGIKATFIHIALDRIAELIELGFNEEEVRKKLIENDLMKYIPDYDEIFIEISREVSPSPKKILNRREFEELARSGVYGMFKVNGTLLPPTAALVKIRSKIRRGEDVYVKWGINAYEARKGKISKKISNIKDLKELIDEIKKAHSATSA